jgi:hypothetical protein
LLTIHRNTRDLRFAVGRFLLAIALLGQLLPGVFAATGTGGVGASVDSLRIMDNAHRAVTVRSKTEEEHPRNASKLPDDSKKEGENIHEDKSNDN